jgi:UDP-N-acetylglucosamine 2-epimerase (non-hydrolysing)
MTIVGTRPEIIKLSEIIKKAEQYFDHILVHTGQNYDYNLNEVFFNQLGLRAPDYYLGVVGDNLGNTIGNVISKSFSILLEIQPDAVLLLGDTNSCLSVISAKRLKIPIFHLEAGNRCFDENLPEEINRRIVDHTSDINLCYTEHARYNLLNEGISSDSIFVLGSPMAEILKVHSSEIDSSKVLDELSLSKGKYILLSAHREENIDNEMNFNALMCSINEMAARYNVPIIYSMHPRSEYYIKKRNFKFHKNVVSLKPFGFFDYIKLQMNSLCVVSDSGTLAEESSILKFPSVSIRTSTERPEAFDKGNILLGNISKTELMQSIDMAIEMSNCNDIGSNVNHYLDDTVSVKTIKIIQSFTSIVNRKVWNK